MTIHYRGVGSERRELAAVPVVGAYIIGPGQERRLWLVDAVAFDGADVDVYAVAVGAGLTRELTKQWERWGGPRVEKNGDDG